MVVISVGCPQYESDQLVIRGKTEQGKQRYRCLQPDCPIETFILEYSYHGCFPGFKNKLIDMASNSSGIRDTALVLKISLAPCQRA